MTNELSATLTAMEIEEKGFELMQRRAKMLASAKMIPEIFRGSISDCAIIIEMAAKMKTDAFEIARQIHIIHGKPGFSAKYLIARLNNSNILTGRLKYEFFGNPGNDDFGCFAYGTERESGEILKGPRITIGMAKADGWYDRNGSKWKTLPDLMLQYRAASFWINTFAPETSLGMPTSEELQDAPIERDITAQSERVSAHAFNREAKPTVIDNEAEEATEEATEDTQEDSPNIDYNTGEIKPTNDLAFSPAFQKLKKKLLKIRDTETYDNFLNDGAINRLDIKERARLIDIHEAHGKAMAADMLTN